MYMTERKEPPVALTYALQQMERAKTKDPIALAMNLRRIPHEILADEGDTA